MIDDKELADLESFMRDTGVMDIAEIIRNARREQEDRDRVFPRKQQLEARK